MTLALTAEPDPPHLPIFGLLIVLATLLGALIEKL